MVVLSKGGGVEGKEGYEIRTPIQVLSSSSGSMCIHLAVNSSLVFRDPRSFLYKNINFSDVHKLHFPVIGEKVFALRNIFQFILNFVPVLLKFHICWLRVVADCLCSSLKELLCCNHLCLNVFPVIPT